MSALFSSSELDRIADARRQMARRLGLDSDTLPVFGALEEPGFFPLLAPETLRTIEQGDRTALARTIDHTLLKPDATPEQIARLCSEAVEKRFRAVCVNGVHVAHARTALGDSGVQTACVVGFPLGQMATAAKAAEARLAVEDGAAEIDMVLNLGWLKSGRWQETFEDIQDVIRAAGVPVKVILETALLDDGQKVAAALLSVFAGAAFVKTSTGFASGGATARDVALLRASVGEASGVKASGGIRSYEDCLAMLRAGANRIGTSSGPAIVG